MRTTIVGGAGFIGSHFVDHLLGEASNEVCIFDNFTSGRRWHFAHHLGDPRLTIVEGDAEDLRKLRSAVDGSERIIHLASNPDIARAMTDPTIDFYQGTVLTNSVVEAARLTGVSEILYASGSGVYGDWGEQEMTEDHGPLLPTSPYGASKLAGEALLSAYSSMFGIAVSAFRFGNVVGPRQTHGVGFDFIRRLRGEPTTLTILGDGLQSKSYVHVNDVVNAVLAMSSTREADFEVHNVATGDHITVREIAFLALEVLNIDPLSCEFIYTGGSRGWKGDVPVVRLSTSKARGRGWRCSLSSRDALKAAMTSMVNEAEHGLLE